LYTNEYDIRQYERMLSCIERFKKGALEINNFISDLEALINCIQEPDHSWKEKFNQEWAVLEDTYSYVLSDDRTIFSNDELDLISRSVENLEALIKQVLH